MPLLVLAGCGNAQFGDIVTMCVTAQDCHYLEIDDCTMPDCVHGQCVLVADRNADGLACLTSNRCVKVPGQCDGGVCVGARQTQCVQVPCMIGRCNPDTGSCEYTQAPDRSECDADGNPCTLDICEAGSCRKGPNSCPCLGVSDCPIPQDLCAGSYTCRLNLCEIDFMTAVICPVDSSCSTHACNPVTGQCDRTDIPDDTVCAEEGPCTLQGRCEKGACRIRGRCDDGNQCTKDHCDPVTGACEHQPFDGNCDDGDPCTGPDMCVVGVCRGHPIQCSDGNPCTFDSCDQTAGCVSEPEKSGTPCDSGDLCVVGSVCDSNGNCGNGVLKCDDHSDCTMDTCTFGICDFEPVQGSCDDGNSCTVGERCSGGVCGEGRLVPGCCNFDADCDDNDLCTVSECADSVCMHHGEPAGLCQMDVGCAASWCQADSGKCGSVDYGFPMVISSWDFTSGRNLVGFGWGSPAGSIGSGGLQPVGDLAAVVFPRRTVRPGVLQAVVELVSGDCTKVTFNPQPSAISCIQKSGRTIVLAAFATDIVCDSDGLVGLQFMVGGGAVVRSADLVLLAASGCDSDGLTFDGTGSATEIAAASRNSLLAFVFRQGSMMSLAGTRTGGGIMSANVVQDPFGVVSGRFGASIVDAGDRWAFAWGAADDKAWIATSTDSGVVSDPRTLPDVASEGEIHAWPSLAVDATGRLALVMSFGQPTNFDVALGLIDKDLKVPVIENWIQPINESSSGNQITPMVILNTDGGAVFWLKNPLDLGQYLVYGRLISQSGEDFDPVNILDFSNDVLFDLDCAYSAGRYYCVWSRADGGIGGVVLDSTSLALKGSFDIPGPSRARPAVIASQDGALVVSISGTGATASIVGHQVSDSGVLSDQFVIATPVLAGLTWFAVTPFGPVHHAIAFTDMLSDRPGIRVVPFSPACPDGFVSGGIVCTGIGDDGRAGGVLP